MFEIHELKFKVMYIEQLLLSYEKPISFFDVRGDLRRMWMVVSVGRMIVYESSLM